MRIKSVLFVVFMVIILFFFFWGFSKIITYYCTKIKNQAGIQKSFYVTLGGQQQFISIRGENKKNPVVIFLHGGPGSPMAYASFYYQKELEQDLTFVCWDQRGCGRTYYKNKNPLEGLCQEKLYSDLDELVDYCRNFFNQDKVIIMAHSNGTTFGLQYAHNNPEKVCRYIGIGQLINAFKGDMYLSEKTLSLMNPESKEYNLFKSIYEKYTKENNPETFVLDDFMSLRKSYASVWKSKKEISFLRQLWLGFSSPYMNLSDVKWFMNMLNINKIYNLEKPLMDYSFFDFDAEKLCGFDFEIPVAFITGEHDFSTPLKLSEDYYNKISSPSKKYYKFPDYGHNMFMDSPKEFTKAIKEIILEN